MIYCILEESVVSHRLDLLSQIIRLLLVMIPDQRKRMLREDSPQYELDELEPAK